LPNNVTRTQTYDALFRKTLVDYKQNTTSQKKFEYRALGEKLADAAREDAGAGGRAGRPFAERRDHPTAAVRCAPAPDVGGGAEKGHGVCSFHYAVR
jgi:hypothetical protein